MSSLQSTDNISIIYFFRKVNIDATALKHPKANCVSVN